MEIAVKALLALIAVAAVIWSMLVIKKIVKLNARFSAAIVLIPLYKKSHIPIIAISVFTVFGIADIVFMVIYAEYLICASLLLICLSVIATSIAIIKLRCAVLDSGIVVPFRFIDWTHLYDYSVENNDIFFCCDNKGNDTIKSATQKMRFDESNLEKLDYILSKHKIIR